MAEPALAPAPRDIPGSVQELDALRARVRPLEEAEIALVRAVVSQPPWLAERDEHALRYALNLARATRVRAPGGEDVDLEQFLEPYRQEVFATAEPLLLRSAGVDRAGVGAVAPRLGGMAREWRRRVAETFRGRLPVEALDRECCEKALILVCGGGGGVSYVFLGGFAVLEQFGLVPRMMAGSSMGSILLLFRARRIHYQPEEIGEVMAKLSFRTLFRFLQTDSRYGLPGAMRLYLRHGVGEFLKGPDGHPLTLGQLAIPLLVSVTGIRNGALPHDPSYYEHLLDLHGRAPRPHVLKRMVTDVLNAVGELVTQRERFARIYLGADAETRDFDAIDAVGFSSALPGVIHYDVLREDDRMHAMLASLFRKHDLFRLVDGGISDNVPARAAWAKAQEGALGTRNTCILGLDGFGPKLAQPLWFGLEQLVAQNVARNRPFMHVHRSFSKTLSPVDLVPGHRQIQKAIQWGKGQLLPDVPLVARLVRPFPPVA
jgi:predicted acylesterase/phospholipase RssA